MKENSELIRRDVITFFPAVQGKAQPLEVLKKIVPNWRKQLGNTLATAGIGMLFLIGIYLFFVQLAEFGWR
ncbi:MAG: hypothetical protein ACWGOX_00425 [Desulforhopalus sp.]